MAGHAGMDVTVVAAGRFEVDKRSWDKRERGAGTFRGSVHETTTETAFRWPTLIYAK